MLHLAYRLSNPIIIFQGKQGWRREEDYLLFKHRLALFAPPIAPNQNVIKRKWGLTPFVPLNICYHSLKTIKSALYYGVAG